MGRVAFTSSHGIPTKPSADPWGPWAGRGDAVDSVVREVSGARVARVETRDLAASTGLRGVRVRRAGAGLRAEGLLWRAGRVKQDSRAGRADRADPEGR